MTPPYWIYIPPLFYHSAPLRASTVARLCQSKTVHPSGCTVFCCYSRCLFLDAVKSRGSGIVGREVQFFLDPQ